MDSTVNNTLQTLAAIMNYAHLNHAAPITPIRWGDLALDLGEREIRVLTKDELRRSWRALRADMHDVIQFALASAKRIDEILSLTWAPDRLGCGTPDDASAHQGRQAAHRSAQRAARLRSCARQRAHQGDARSPTDRVFTFVARRTRSYFHRTTKAVIGNPRRRPALSARLRHAAPRVRSGGEGAEASRASPSTFCVTPRPPGCCAPGCRSRTFRARSTMPTSRSR